MGDKSPKANQKQKAQQKAKANSAAQKKESNRPQPPRRRPKEMQGDAAKQQPTLVR